MTAFSVNLTGILYCKKKQARVAESAVAASAVAASAATASDSELGCFGSLQ